MTDYRVVLCTCSSIEEAQRLARALVEESLCACVNIVSNVQSVYRWKNEVCSDPENLLIIKTTVAAVNRLEARLSELHSYDCPEIISLTIEDGHAPYLAWISDQVTEG